MLITPLVNSTVTVFLGGVPKTTGAYPPKYSIDIYDIDLHATTTYPTLSWSGSSGALGEHIKAVNNTNKYGTVALCFYGNPSGLWYPGSGSYPLTLSWTGTFGAASYDISYTVYPQGGSPIIGNVNSATNTYVFPYAKYQYSGGTIVSKVRARYPGNVVSDWSSPYNTTIQ